jgi:DNA-directed RNA polymerase subunit K/omega
VIDSKKIERFEETIKSYYTFVDSYKSSKFARESESFYLSSLKELEKLKIETMAYKDSTAERTTITRSLRELESETSNIYETITVLSKRSNQINVEMKEELNQKLDEFATSTDNLEEIFENREQIEVSRYYERLPKSGAIAIQELENEKIFWKSPENEDSNE